MVRRARGIVPALSILAFLLLVAAPAAGQEAPAEVGEPAQSMEAPAEPPSSEDVLYALRDVRLPLEGLQVRNALRTDSGGSALLQLPDGTLVDVRMGSAQDGWTVRNVSLIAGSAADFYAWSEPWRDRVAAAQNFLAGAETAGMPTRTAEELAPLSWFEDPDEASRLWGMNPVTYRMMQTLQMMPVLQGPTGGGTPGNPVPRRNDQ